MKKLGEMLKPFYSIILGTLMLLFYMDLLQSSGAWLALGIVGMVFAAYYICVGIATVVTGDKLSAPTRGIIESLSVLLFPVFMFVFFLITAIGGAGSPTDWVIVILGMVSSIGFTALYVLSVFGKNSSLMNLTRLFAFIFILALILFILLFIGNGTLGGINIVQFAICVVYSVMLISAVEPTAEEESKTEE